MSTTVCQRVQPQFDSRLVEPWRVQLQFPSRCSPSPRHAMAENPALEHNIQAPFQDTGRIHFCNEYEMKNSASKNGNFGGWSFLQALSNPTQNVQIENEKVYVHPLVKRSTSALSEKSLEMCTESLGSETGSTISENGDDLISSFSQLEIEKSSRMPCYTSKKRPSYTANFPPPLSTIRSGYSSGVQVKSSREDGRLVIEVVSVGTPQTCFKAERRDGKLKLQFLHGSSTSISKDCDEFHESNQDYVQGDANEGDYDDDYVNDGESDENINYDDDDDDDYEMDCSVC